MSATEPTTRTVRRARLVPRGEAIGRELLRFSRFTRGDCLHYLDMFTRDDAPWVHLSTAELRETCIALRAADLYQAQPRSLIRIETT